MVERKILPTNRRDHILALLDEYGTVSVSQLAKEMAVSAITIRRDIALLAEEGKLEQIRGGARRLAVESPARVPANSTIGVLTPSLDFYWPTIIDGANQSADNLGIRLLLQASTFAAQDNIRQLEILLKHSKVDGLFMVPNTEGPHSAELIEKLIQLDLPVVLVERELGPRSTDGQVFESVSTDHRRGAAMAIRHLHGLGHQRVGLITDKEVPSRHAIRRGWEETLSDLQMDTSSPALDTTCLSSSKRSKALVKFLEECMNEDVTAFLIHSDEAALLALEVLEARGYEVPRDVSIVAYDDELARLARPALTAIAPPKEEIGAAAIEVLAKRFISPNSAQRQVRLQPRLVVRNSTAAPRAGSSAADQPEAD
ncbi:MAG: substrate-binding domain-containing protein [Actinomycetaceae bacterium]|nr:substrate-binding domain-containing protein [Actinomycetaceae bacterium]